jgi:hypothetical protein
MTSILQTFIHTLRSDRLHGAEYFFLKESTSVKNYPCFVKSKFHYRVHKSLFEITNFLDIIHRLSLIKTSPELGTNSIYWVQQSRCPLYLMSETDSSLRNVVCLLSRIDDG